MARVRNEPIQQRARDTLDSIIAAADRLFAERGVGDTTNQMIADSAGVSIGTVYRFFPNKTALVAEYLNRYLEFLAANLPEQLPETPDLDDLDEIIADLLGRSIVTRRTFRGYGRVRLWSDPETGELVSKPVRDSELALISGLLSSSPYDLPADLMHRMTVVIVDSTWPLIEGLLELPERECALMVAEIERYLSVYIRNVVAEFS